MARVLLLPYLTQSATLFLLPIIREKAKLDSIVYTDFYKSCDVLDVSARINHSTDFAEKQNHINGIENFFGIKQNDICINLTSFPKLILIFILKNAYGVLITVT